MEEVFVAAVETLERFFALCRRETARDPKAALPLVLDAPVRVERQARTLGTAYPDFKLQSLGLVGTALVLAGNQPLAGLIFAGCDGIPASPSEGGGLLRRRALYELYGGEWAAARDLADQAVKVFETAPSLRDDCSLSAALAMRGMIEGFVYQQGVEGFDRDRAADFLTRALEVSEPGYRMTRLAALSGLGRVLVSGWMGTGRPKASEVMDLVKLLSSMRADLRRERTPYRGLLDANLRWLLALPP
jgi:hypothetical protein